MRTILLPCYVHRLVPLLVPWSDLCTVVYLRQRGKNCHALLWLNTQGAFLQCFFFMMEVCAACTPLGGEIVLTIRICNVAASFMVRLHLLDFIFGVKRRLLGRSFFLAAKSELSARLSITALSNINTKKWPHVQHSCTIVQESSYVWSRVGGQTLQ